MATSKDDILKAIEEMSVMDLVDLISAIEEKFGITRILSYIYIKKQPNHNGLNLQKRKNQKAHQPQ